MLLIFCNIKRSSFQIWCSFTGLWPHPNISSIYLFNTHFLLLRNVLHSYELPSKNSFNFIYFQSWFMNKIVLLFETPTQYSNNTAHIYLLKLYKYTIFYEGWIHKICDIIIYFFVLSWIIILSRLGMMMEMMILKIEGVVRDFSMFNLEMCSNVLFRSIFESREKCNKVQFFFTFLAVSSFSCWKVCWAIWHKKELFSRKFRKCWAKLHFFKICDLKFFHSLMIKQF